MSDPCPHDLAERETACADGMCPLCMVAEIERLRALVHTLADDLEGELRGHYGPTMDYPSERRRFERDMANVYAAREALNSTRKPPADPQ